MIKKRMQTGVALLLTTTLLVGCSIPHQYEKAPLQAAEELGSGQAFHEITEMNWPADTWWQRYKDPQLQSLIEEALKDSPSMDAAEARFKSAQGMVRQAGALEKVQVGAALDASMTKVSYQYQAYMAPKNWNDYGSMLLDFSYEFDFWGKNRAIVAAATSRMAAMAAEKAAAGIILSTGVANGYAELARLYANKDTVEAALEVRRKTVDQLDRRYRNGLETKGAVSQAQAAAAGVEAELLALQEAIKLQKNGLAALLGKGPDRGAVIARPTIKLSQKFGLPADVGVGLLGHRPDVSAARWRAEAASRQIDAARAQFYPNVSLSAFIGLQAFGIADLFESGNDAGSVGPAIYLPIFSGGRLEGQLSAAEAGYELAVGEYNETLVQAIRQVADAVTSLQALDDRIAKTREAVAAARDAHQIASNRYEGGLARYLDVLTAEDALLNNERALVNLESRAFSLDLALVYALGGGYTTKNS